MISKAETAKRAVQAKGSTVGVLDLLGVMFIGLKLTGHISWSWWLVTLPLWFTYAAIIVLMALYAIAVGCGLGSFVFVDCIDRWAKRRIVRS